MQRLLILVVLLTLAEPARAGVYNLAEVHPFLELHETRGYYLRVRSASILAKTPPSPESFKALILRQVAALEQQKADGTFSTIDRINLAGCYLRLGGDRIAEAQRLLIAGDQKDFLIQSNLAATYFLSGQMEMAIRHQQTALAAWPEVFAGWSESQLRSYREAERLLLTLFRLRAEETRRGPVRGEVDVDALFPRLRFVGLSGAYEAGGLSLANRDLMPDNAFRLVYQLLMWFPTDMRLYWLFGELLNAAGSVDQAHDIFIELVEAGMARSFKDLPKHRRVLIDAKPIFQKYSDRTFRGVLLSELMMLSRPPLAPSVIGDVAYLAGCSANAVFAPHAVPRPEIPLIGPALGSPSQQTPVFNFRHIAVGFAFGFVVAMLCALQWQEWRRRRFQAAFAREESEPVPIRSPGESTSITPGG